MTSLARAYCIGKDSQIKNIGMAIMFVVLTIKIPKNE